MLWWAFDTKKWKSFQVICWSLVNCYLKESLHRQTISSIRGFNICLQYRTSVKKWQHCPKIAWSTHQLYDFNRINFDVYLSLSFHRQTISSIKRSSYMLARSYYFSKNCNTVQKSHGLNSDCAILIECHHQLM